MATHDFSRLADIEEIAGEKFDQVVRGTLLDLTSAIIEGTPVGDIDQWESVQQWRARNGSGGRPPWLEGYVGGTARGNWQATIGSPAKSEIDRVDDTGRATLTDAQDAISRAPGNVWYLTNNVPYIGRLEYMGHSKQAPEGFVRVNLRRLEQSIEEQASRARSGTY